MLTRTLLLYTGWLWTDKVVTFWDESGAYLDVYTTMRFGLWSTLQRIEPEVGPKLWYQEGFWW